MSGLPTQALALLTRRESHIPPLSVAVNRTNHVAPTRRGLVAGCGTVKSRNAHSVLTVNSP